MRPRSVLTAVKAGLRADRRGRALLAGGVTSLSVRVGGLFLSYALHVVLSRVLGLHEYGRYVVALAWAAVLGVPARAGFDYSALRYVTIYRAGEDWRSMRGFVVAASVSVIALSVLFGVAVVLVPIAIKADAQPSLLFWTALLIGPAALIGLFSVFMRTANKIFASQFYDQALRPIVALVLIGALLIMRHPVADANIAMFLTAVASGIALVLLLVHFRGAFGEIFRVASSLNEVRSWLGASGPLLLIAGIQELLNQVPLLMLGIIANARSAGLFAAALRLSSVISFALAALSVVSGPLVASAFHRDDLEDLAMIARVTARISLAFGVVAGTLLIIFGPALLALFGKAFAPAYPALLVLVIAGVANALTGVVAYLLTLTGRELQALYIFLAALFISVALNALLIPVLGATGAAIASGSGTLTWNLIMVLYVRRLTGIDASAVGLRPLQPPGLSKSSPA